MLVPTTIDSLDVAPLVDDIFTRSGPNSRMSSARDGPATAIRYEVALAIAASTLAVSNGSPLGAGVGSAANAGTAGASASTAASAASALRRRISAPDPAPAARGWSGS